ncbi:hypothetical protein U1Q18_017425 [Sarracenia purpurea var. burkii]
MDCNWIGLVAASRGGGGGEQRRRREEVLASRGGGDGGRWELGQSRRWWTVAAQGMASPMVDGGVSDGGWWTVAEETSQMREIRQLGFVGTCRKPLCEIGLGAWIPTVVLILC